MLRIYNSIGNPSKDWEKKQAEKREKGSSDSGAPNDLASVHQQVSKKQGTNISKAREFWETLANKEFVTQATKNDNPSVSSNFVQSYLNTSSITKTVTSYEDSKSKNGNDWHSNVKLRTSQDKREISSDVQSKDKSASIDISSPTSESGEKLLNKIGIIKRNDVMEEIREANKAQRNRSSNVAGLINKFEASNIETKSYEVSTRR